MKSKKGFTLIEIIGAIVILGIVAIIAFATYSSSLKGFRSNYYTSLVRTLEESAEEFFNDNRNYRPTYPLVAAELPINTLETKHYIDSVVDYNGKACSSRSYVMILKEGRNDFSYHACLICNEDAYDNTNDMYCDKMWLDPTKVEYGLGTPETLYIYKGTTKEELRAKLELPISYVRKDVEGNIIKEIRGTGEGEPTLLPNNIDVVNTAVEGTYRVEYEYKTEKANRDVIVYENEKPTISYKKEQTVATTLAGATTVETNTYESGTWAQNVVVTLSSGAYTEPEVTTSKFQWNKDGIWADFCTTDPCTVKITTEMNQTVQFRLIDSNGNVSRFTDPITIRIDNTKPSCSLEIPTTIGEHDWYNKDVTIQFSSKSDATSSGTSYDGVLRSEIIRYNVLISTADLVRAATENSNTHNEDGTSIIYIGYVEDAAENFNTCSSITFKRDATPPECGFTLTGTVGWDSWYVGNVGVEITTHTDNLSGVTNNGEAYGTGSLTGDKSFTHKENTAGITYTGHIKDEAGNTNTCTKSLKKDSTAPSCSIKKSNQGTTAGVTLTVTCSDGNGPSNCNSENSQTGTYYNKKTGTHEFIVYDNAGNSGKCSTTVTGQDQRADRSCSSISRCENASGGCEKHKECEAEACGKTCGGSCNCVSYNSYSTKSFSNRSACLYNSGCYSYCGGSGSNAMVGGTQSSCYCSTNTCEDPSCDCDYYYEDITNCGCATWGEYGNWYNVTSCSENTSNYESSNNICQTLYS